jgi:ankyrin repeat protein
LLWAIFSDAVAAATWLLDRGAAPDLRHDFGGSEHGKGATAMHLAAQYSCLKCLQLLLNRGADPTILDDRFGGTPLGWARYGEAADAVAVLEARLGE